MNTKIISSGNEVILDCDFLTYDDKPCKISFDHSGVDFLITLTFINHKETENPSFTYRVEESNFFLDLVNFNGAFGHGNIEPIELGDLGGRKLFIRFWVTKPGTGTSSKHVKLTAYLGGEE